MEITPHGLKPATRLRGETLRPPPWTPGRGSVRRALSRWSFIPTPEGVWGLGQLPLSSFWECPGSTPRIALDQAPTHPGQTGHEPGQEDQGTRGDLAGIARKDDR